MAEEKTPQRGIVQIDDKIRKACGIADEDAYFAFDSSHLTRDDHGVLQKVAKCFESGPLKGHNMSLIGHADARGDSDYNMVLGGSRADTVKGFMVAQGVHRTAVATTSRGALDANGTDETSWAKDRRVDIMLKN
ncbi:MAG TPA: OmpA family protein [Polyangiaceae bacterium]